MTINKTTYSEQYNPHFRPITNQQITTVEISPTGSGKTHFYKNSRNTIMLMPTNMMVRQNSGMVSKDKAKTGERCEWKELDTSKCDYMTYDKFHGHSMYEDMSDINVIIDEAHLILASMNEVHYELLDRLFNRKFKYKELKFISATLRSEILDIYDFRDNEPLQVNQYINKNLNPVIRFTTKLPDMSGGIRTLFFINSKDKMIQVKEYYESVCPHVKVALISAEDEVPNIFEMASINLFISTCVLKQGYSLYTVIDQVIIHNVYNALGAMDIIQYMARPRINQPKIYVIPALTHFKTEEDELFDMPDIASMLAYVARDGHIDTQLYKANSVLVMDEFLARAKTSKSGWNILGVTNYYEKLLTYYELHCINGTKMIDSIKEVIPGARVIVRDLRDGHELKFTMLELDESAINMIQASKDTDELEDNLKIVMNSTTNARIIEKMKKYLKTIPNIVTEFRFTPKGEKLPSSHKFDNATQVLQVLEPTVRSQCKQHIKNLDAKVYDFRDTNLRYAPNLGEIILVSKLGRKLNFIREYFSGMPDNLELLGKIYCFKRYDKDGVELTSKSRKKVVKVEITSMYCVEESWYYKSNIFLTVGKNII